MTRAKKKKALNLINIVAKSSICWAFVVVFLDQEIPVSSPDCAGSTLNSWTLICNGRQPTLVNMTLGIKRFCHYAIMKHLL